jgi:MoxR-like ATPase
LTASAPSAAPASSALAAPRARSLDAIREALGQVIRGKAEVIELLLVGVLGGGHVLVEDVPGVGKTTLAKALSRTFRATFARVQFTPDLLPSDILGSQVLSPRDGSLAFHKGPVFANVLLADEINRASPRTQSALLEAMSEAQVTIDGTTHPLPAPFFVVATQNPVDYQGTYPLPEAQLDRFLIRIGVGYPALADELAMLFARQHRDPLDTVEPLATMDDLLALQTEVREVEVRDAVAEYLLRVVGATREHKSIELGISPRGALALFRASQAQAYLAGRRYVSPADVERLAGPVLGHRLVLTTEARYGGTTARTILAGLVKGVPVPT